MSPPAALVETWTLYSVGSLIIICRIACRWRMIGIGNFHPDDYIIVLSWATYTVMTVAAHIVGGTGDLHALPLDMRSSMTTAEAEPFVWATQWFCAGVATYNLFIWTLKLNMLFLYQRIVKGTWVEKFIVPTMTLVGVTFVANLLILFTACRPYNRMWIVWPDQGHLCIMAIPAPVVLPVRTTIWKRLGLVVLFTAGIFIVIAAILRVTMVLLTANGPTAAIWSVREDFVAIVVGQSILLPPMFTTRFWTGPRAADATGYSNTTGNSKLDSGYDLSSRKRSTRSKDPFSVTRALATVHADDDDDKTGTTENLVAGKLGLAIGSYDGPEESKEKSKKIVIHVSRQVNVLNEERSSFDEAEPRLSIYQRGSYLEATNNPKVWNEDEYHETS